MTVGDTIREVREAVEFPCADFPGSCRRELDATRDFPDAFVAGLTEDGVLGARFNQSHSCVSLGARPGDATLVLKELP